METQAMKNPTVDDIKNETAQPLQVESKPAPAPVPRAFRDLLALDDFERHAQRVLPPIIFQYVAGGVETQSSVRIARICALRKRHGAAISR